MANNGRGAKASHESPGAKALRMARAAKDPKLPLLLDEVGETTFSTHALGRSLPGADALGFYRDTWGLHEEDFYDGATRARHKRYRDKLARLATQPSNEGGGA